MDRIEALKVKGVRIGYEGKYVGEGKERHRVDIKDRITGVGLWDVLTPEQWLGMTIREGVWYIGGCCGNLSAAQDIIQGVLRDTGWIDGADLLTIGNYVGTHDGFEDDFAELDDAQFRQRLDRWVELDPWAKIGTIFKAVESCLVPRRHELPQTERPDRDFNVLANTLDTLRWGDLFASDEPKHREQYERTRLVKLARILEPLRKALATVESQQARFEGYGIVSPGTEELLYNGMGLCLYQDQNDAQQVIKQWERWAREDDEQSEVEAEIVPVKVSVQEGVRILR